MARENKNFGGVPWGAERAAKRYPYKTTKGEVKLKFGFGTLFWRLWAAAGPPHAERHGPVQI